VSFDSEVGAFAGHAVTLLKGIGNNTSASFQVTETDEILNAPLGEVVYIVTLTASCFGAGGLNQGSPTDQGVRAKAEQSRNSAGVLRSSVAFFTAPGTSDVWAKTVKNGNQNFENHGDWWTVDPQNEYYQGSVYLPENVDATTVRVTTVAGNVRQIIVMFGFVKGDFRNPEGGQQQ
jgi:hypothetical protein